VEITSFFLNPTESTFSRHSSIKSASALSSSTLSLRIVLNEGCCYSPATPFDDIRRQ
jgi:hypothetical protein